MKIYVLFNVCSVIFHVSEVCLHSIDLNLKLNILILVNCLYRLYEKQSNASLLQLL